MDHHPTVRRRAGLAVATLITLGATLLVAPPAPASAGVAPIVDPATAPTVTADVLPTVQVDGVVWSQVVVGDTVYAGGDFDTVRPAGAAPGTSLTAQANLLAYDITTGELIAGFAPTINGQVMSVAASPDGTRIYAVGDFTAVGGVTRRRVAAFDAATGALIESFAPVGVTAQARAVIATADTVYVGGGFVGAGQTARGNLAAFRASDGALLPWNPNADYTVWGVAVSSDGSSVFAGGSFQNVGGQPAYGLAKIDAATGALLPWNAANTVRNAGPDAGVSSVRVQNGFVYGTTWHFGAGGNLEGTFKAPVGTGDVEWVTDCHGDNYSAYLHGNVVYTASHAHYCGNVAGFPQYPTWKYQHAQAWTDAAAGDILNDLYGYHNWRGKAQAPAIVGWLPTFTIGSVSGMSQAVWSVTGNADYVVYGGEFPRVNGINQQGLVRFARREIAPRLQGPKFLGNQIVPTLSAMSPTSVRISFLAGYDADHSNLRYRINRIGTNGAIATLTAASSWWNTPALSHVDSGLAAGGTYSYRITVDDADGNTVYGATRSITLPADVPTNAYAERVRADGASTYFPLDEPAGTTTFVGRSGPTDGTGGSGATFGVAGAIAGSTAIGMANTTASRITTTGTEMAPDTFTAQIWIKTSATSGGLILGFGDQLTGTTGREDRVIYMQNNGRLMFGVRGTDNTPRMVSSASSYNDNAWHQVTATMGPDGMNLYVDGVRVGRRTDTSSGEGYYGYWRIGSNDLNGWPSKPTALGLVGSVDEMAIYPTALTHDQVIAQFAASGRTAAVPAPPGDDYGQAVYVDDPDIYWRLHENNILSTVAASAGRTQNPGTYRNAPTLGQTGVIAGNRAVRFDGTNDLVTANNPMTNPTTYSVEAWFRTTTTRGGTIVGFGNGATSGTSSTRDRQVYMRNNGQVAFVTAGAATRRISSSTSYNDNAWHHVVAAQSAAGMRLYVDGSLVASDPQATAGNYTGYWKVAGDPTGDSTSAYFAGTVDEVAVYARALPGSAVRAHHIAGGGVANQPPAAAFTSSADHLAVALDATSSTDADGTIVGHAWNFGDGTNGTGPTVTKTYASAGTYTVTLTVTDDRGAISSASQTVSVQAANVAPTAVPAATIEHLALAVDGSASSDPDGTIVGYAWDFGDGASATGPTATHTYATPGTYTVTLTVTDDRGGTAVATADVVAAEAPNQPPTATFTASAADLAATVDGSASSDGDGTVTTYSWDFGDGDGAAGPTAVHTYAAAGTYTVTLTVTDDDGATASTTRDVTVVAANVAPTAAIAASSEHLAVDVDGSGSSDGDGSIVAYAWDFGDSASATGPAASHTYGVAGTYTITLTVTDDDGAVATTSTEVTVTAPPTIAADGFGRTVVNGLGVADTGGSWTLSGNATNFNVAGGRAAVRMAAGSGPGAYLNAVAATDIDARVAIGFDKAPTGGGIYASLVGRRIGTSDYRVKVRVQPTATVVHLVRTIGGAETVLATAPLPGVVYNPGDVLNVRLQVDGTGTTSLRTKVWSATTSEPATWTLSATDTTAALQAPGAVGLYAFLSGSATNAPVLGFFDDLVITTL